MAAIATQVDSQVNSTVKLSSQSQTAQDVKISNEHAENTDKKEKLDYQKLNDPNDHSFIKIDLPSLPSDNRCYRFLRLENGLKVLFIHHPIKVTSKALLRVHAGSYDEPDAFPGLAHFLEHMLFMGSKKYPDEDAYHRYISEHSGEFNANTGNEDTNFHFEIENQHFEPAIDRFAQFFIAPLLKAECAEREMQAVDNEFEGKKDQDFFRLNYISKKLVNPKHPEARFDFGSYETLKNVELVLPAMKQFYDKYYKANNMTLIFESKLSLDEQEVITKRYFSQIPRTKEKYSRPKIPRYLPNTFQIKYCMESIQHTNAFAMKFLFSGNRTLENEAALRYIVSLISNPSPGGLFDYLKNQRLVTNVSGGISFFVDYDFKDHEQNFDLTIMLPLTPNGLSKTDDIVRSTLDYIYFLKQNGVNEKIFNELQQINEITFRFKAFELRDPEDFMELLCDYPLEKFFFGGSVTKETPFSKQRIQEILSEFSPKTLRLVVIQDCAIEGESEVEVYTGAKFKKEEVSASINNWIEPKKNSPLPFSLPEPNLYLPQNFIIKPQLPQFKMPTMIHEAERLRVWLSHDHHFHGQSVQTDCYLISRDARNTARAELCLSVFFLMFNMELKRQLSRHFDFAGVSAYFDITAVKGPCLKVIGYADKHDKVILEIFNLLMRFELKEENFAREKQTLMDALLKTKTEKLFVQALTHMQSTLGPLSYTTEELLNEMKTFDIKMLHEFRQNLLTKAKVEVVCHGNMTPYELINIGKGIVQTLNLKDSFQAMPRASFVKIKEGGNFHYTFKSNSNGSVMVLLLHLDDHSAKNIYLCNLLLKIVQPKYFDQLRTKEQLGYTVDCFINMTGGLGLGFVIEASEHTAAYLLERTEMFLQDVLHELKSISEMEFNSFKESLNNVLGQLHRPNSPNEFRGLFSPLFQSHKYRFNQIFDILKVHEGISLVTLTELYSKMIHPGTGRQLVVKSKDKSWDESNLIDLFSENLEKAKESQTSIANIANLIFAYTKTSCSPYLDIADIPTFKRAAEWTPDFMAEGEQYIQSILEFNQNLPIDSFVNGEIVDEERVKEALTTTALANCPPVVGTVLTYCFRDYKIKEREREKATTSSVSCLEKMTVSTN